MSWSSDLEQELNDILARLSACGRAKPQTAMEANPGEWAHFQPQQGLNNGPPRANSQLDQWMHEEAARRPAA